MEIGVRDWGLGTGGWSWGFSETDAVRLGTEVGDDGYSDHDDRGEKAHGLSVAEDLAEQ